MKYLRLLSRLEGACLLISEDKLRLITEKVTLPLFLGEAEQIEKLPVNSLRIPRDRNTMSVSQGQQKLGVIEVFDSLVSKDASAASGMTSYQDIAMQIDRAVEFGYTQLIFNLDSPGGEAAGLFSLTDKIRKLSSQGIQTIGYADGMATSAGYAILAACSEVYATETTILGSIAALMVHVDVSEKDKTDGKTYTIFRSKAEKALGDSHSPLTEQAVNKITTLLDTMDTAFNNDILKSRGISIDQIKSMKGSEFMAEKALEMKLIDKIVSGFDETLLLASSSKSTQNTKGGRMTLEEAEAKIVILEAEKIALGASISDLNTKLEAAQGVISAGASFESQISAALSAQKNEISTYLTTATTLRIDASKAVGILADSTSVSAALENMKVVAKYAAPVISSSADLQSTVILSADEQESETKKAAALAAYNKATGVK
jgi:ClpP class serine protease